jgi:hypothetical protein
MDIGKNNMLTSSHRGGSALILAVVLTSLLAMIGALFFMSSRVEKMSASSLANQQDLDSAVETVLARIMDQLALDVPGMPMGGEYCDYPDSNDLWLASLEPTLVGPGTYRWLKVV